MLGTLLGIIGLVLGLATGGAIIWYIGWKTWLWIAVGVPLIMFGIVMLMGSFLNLFDKGEKAGNN